MTDNWWLIGVEGKGSGLGTWNLSVRTTNCLKEAEIFTESDLLSQTEDSLLLLPYFGVVCLDEIVLKMRERGLSLPISDETEQRLRNSKPIPPAIDSTPSYRSPRPPWYDLMSVWENNLGQWEFSVRTTTCLTSEKILTEEDLLQQSEKSLLVIKNFGELSLQEIKQKLDERGLKLTEIKKFKVSPASFPNLLSQGYEPSQISQMTNTELSKVEETLELYRLADEGYTLEEIGKKLTAVRGNPLTRERVRQLITKYWPELTEARKGKTYLRKQKIASENKLEKFAKKKIEFTDGTGIDANEVLDHLRESTSTLTTAKYFDIPQVWVDILYDLTPDDFPKCYRGSQYRVTNEEILENLKYAYETLNKGKLTMQMYESFRAEMNPNPDEKQSSWVHHQSVIRKFGAWQTALEEAGIPIFEVGSWLHDSPSFTDDELLEFLRNAYNALSQEKLSWNMYREYRDTQDAYWPHGPMMQNRFGSWNKALEAAGIPTAKSGRGSGKNYSDEELLDFLRTAYTELNQGQLTTAMYRDFAGQQENGLSSKGAFQNRFGSWNKALEAAGIPTSTGAHTNRNHSDEELLDFLRTAYTELNQGQLTIAMYRDFAAQQENEFSGISSFQKRFGSWNKALEAAGIPTR